MALTTRVLPPEDYGRLAGTELETSVHILSSLSRVIVVEDDGRIVACWALVPMWHAEGVWVDPGRPHTGAVRRLLVAMADEAVAVGASCVLTASNSPVVDAILSKLDTHKLPPHYVLSLDRWRTKETPCLSRP